MIEGYFRQMGELIANTGIVHSSTISYDKRSAHVGFIRGTIYFIDPNWARWYTSYWSNGIDGPSKQTVAGSCVSASDNEGKVAQAKERLQWQSFLIPQ